MGMFNQSFKSGLDVALDSSLLGYSSVYNKAVNPNDIFHTIATQTMFKSVPLGAASGGLIGASTAAFDNNDGYYASYMDYTKNGALIGAGIGGLVGAPMLVRTTKNLFKDVGLGQNGRSVADDILNM